MTDFNSIIAHLLSNSEPRRLFLTSPTEFVQHCELEDEDRTLLLALDPVGLERQAAGLISKRFSEVVRIAPRSMSRVPHADHQFRKFADGFWPTGHQRHLADTVEFLRYLVKQGETTVDHVELNRLGFRYSRRRLAVHFLRRNRSSIIRRWGVQVLFTLWSRNGAIREVLIH